jgi:membrane protease YdiL (CAAX protease family)
VFSHGYIVDLLVFFLQLGIWTGLFALVVTLSILHRGVFRRHFKAGLVLGVMCLALMLPNVTFAMFFLEPAELIGEGPGEPASRFRQLWLRIGMILGGLLVLLRVGWYMLEYYAAAAEWRHFKPDPFPILQGREDRRFGTLFAALGFGLMAGILSIVAIKALGVDVGEGIKHLQQLFPRAMGAPLAVRLPVFVLAACALAVAEELAFRGVLLGWLLRIGRPRGAYAVLMIALVSLLWALLHIPNTNAPVLKCGQIFVIGLFLGEFARRWSVEAAMAGHLALNATVVALALIVYRTPLG